MEYDLELEKAADVINQSKANLVLLQLPDGLKPKAKQIQDELKEKTQAKVMIWAGTCFGACDVPVDTEKIGIGLVIQWGHSAWKT